MPHSASPHALLLSLLLPLFLASSARASDEDCSTLLVENAEGASIVIPAAGEKRELEIDDTLSKGDAVATGKEAWVDLRLCDGSGVRVGEKSKMTFEEALDKSETSFVSWAFDLIKGSLLATVEGDDKKERVKMRVRTPSASLGVRGTEFLIDAQEGGETTVHTMEGEVLLGRREDYQELAKPSFKDFQARFEAIRKEHKSRMGMGQARPEKAMAFNPGQMREQRMAFFRKPIERVQAATVRARFQEARGRRVERGGARAMPGGVRQERKEQRQDRREERKEQRQERSEERKGQLQERREERKEQRQERSEERKGQLQERREERKGQLQERREHKQFQPPSNQGGQQRKQPGMNGPRPGGGARGGGQGRSGPGRR